MHKAAVSFIRQHVLDPPRLCHSLLLGKLESSPFSPGQLEGFRNQWAEALGKPGDSGLLERPSGQPFLLKALSLSAELLEDPDWGILTEGQDCFLTGVPVGFGEPIEHVPQVFSLKEHWRKLDESEPDFDRANYKSAELSASQLLAKFREEEKLGRRRPTTLGALREEYPEDRIRVASMGAIEKPDGSVRPVHDGTHGVLVMPFGQPRFSSRSCRDGLCSSPGRGSARSTPGGGSGRERRPPTSAHPFLRSWSFGMQIRHRVTHDLGESGRNVWHKLSVVLVGPIIRDNWPNSCTLPPSTHVLSVRLRRRSTYRFLWTPEVH